MVTDIIITVARIKNKCGDCQLADGMGCNGHRAQ